MWQAEQVAQRQVFFQVLLSAVAVCVLVCRLMTCSSVTAIRSCCWRLLQHWWLPARVGQLHCRCGTAVVSSVLLYCWLDTSDQVTQQSKPWPFSGVALNVSAEIRLVPCSPHFSIHIACRSADKQRTVNARIAWGVQVPWHDQVCFSGLRLGALGECCLTLQPAAHNLCNLPNQIEPHKSAGGACCSSCRPT